MGRDIVTVHESHRELAVMLFSRIRKDVNRFVDDVYAPHQIQIVLADQKAQYTAGDEDNFFAVLNSALAKPQDVQAQNDVIDFMKVLVELVLVDVNEYRLQRMEVIQDQEKQVLGDIERAYDQIERGNAAVTAHLESVIKVHGAQDDLLSAVDLAGLREKIGIGVSKMSSRVSDFVEKAERVEGHIDDAKETMSAATDALDKIVRGE